VNNRYVVLLHYHGEPNNLIIWDGATYAEALSVVYDLELIGDTLDRSFTVARKEGTEWVPMVEWKHVAGTRTVHINAAEFPTSAKGYQDE
jgi:uncharacterized protein with HEPN domain